MAQKKKIVPFFFHTEEKAKALTGDPMKAYLSNWSRSEFRDKHDHTFYCNEQYMMYRKARLFKDKKMAKEILNAVTEDDLDLPDTQWNQKMKKVKMMGKQVQNFDSQVWDDHKEKIVLTGLLYKFQQNPEMEEMLRSTNDAILVEAARTDTIWGVG